MKMNKYVYKARGQGGGYESGFVHATDEKEAFVKLKLKNLYPIDLKISNNISETLNLRYFKNKSELFENLFSDLSVMMRSGNNLSQSLSVLSDGSEIIKKITQSVYEGQTFEQSIRLCLPKDLKYLCGIISSFEARGDLASGLESAHCTINRNNSIKKQLIDSLTYPLFVLFASFISIMVIILYVIPSIYPVLIESGVVVPVYLKLIYIVSLIINNYWYCFLLFLFILFFIFAFIKRLERFDMLLSGWLLDGWFGNMARGLAFGAYVRTIGECLTGGGDLVEALRLAQSAIRSPAATKRCEVVLMVVLQGRSLSDGFRQVRGFPVALVRLCEVGEASGLLGQVLVSSGDMVEKKALEGIDRFTKALGPILIMIMGLFVGMIMVSIMGALTNLSALDGLSAG